MPRRVGLSATDRARRQSAHSPREQLLKNNKKEGRVAWWQNVTVAPKMARRVG